MAFINNHLNIDYIGLFYVFLDIGIGLSNWDIAQL